MRIIGVIIWPIGFINLLILSPHDLTSIVYTLNPELDTSRLHARPTH